MSHESKNVINYDVCPKCKSLDIEINISSKTLNSTCKKCGFMADNERFHEYA
jgi:predicted Zn-ribbon and HTH transcriptional regulator